MALQSITIIPDGDPAASCTYRIIYRGMLEDTRQPFVVEEYDIDKIDVLTTIQTALVTNYVNWGITNDIA